MSMVVDFARPIYFASYNFEGCIFPVVDVSRTIFAITAITNLEIFIIGQRCVYPRPSERIGARLVSCSPSGAPWGMARVSHPKSRVVHFVW
jgi:hypothetical protein